MDTATLDIPPMSRRPPAAPANMRNGLKWRDGRPRWEPSPRSRELGLKGQDLKTLDGAWMDRGAAIAAADARAQWAALIREAAAEGAIGAEARADLVQVLEHLPQPRDAADRQARAVVEDLIAASRRFLGQPELAVIAGGGARSVTALVEAYFADPVLQAGPFALSAATRRAYKTHSKRIIARLGHMDTGAVTRGALRAWYVELFEDTSPWTANAVLAAAGAFFKWAMHNDWIQHTPATQLGRIAPGGRRVFWTVEEELSFVPWCDANGFEDVADAVILGLWTGARSWDMCEATVEDLSGDDWRYVPHKTAKTGREALPGLLQPVRARVERRRAAAARDKVRGFSATPFLYDFRLERPHTSDTIGYRFREAKFLALLRDAVPETMADKRLQDTRDTCITRLYEADVKLDKIPAWTAHSSNDRDDILREHYIVLRSAGAAEAAQKLAGWASRNGLKF
jgi:hypothetical protein